MKTKKVAKKDNLLKYFIAGIIAAAIIYVILLIFNKDDVTDQNVNKYQWSADMDSVFVKNCYNKYRSQIMDDPLKKVSTLSFCKCMLEKIKTKYSEKDMGKVKPNEIKQWDAECRSEILNPNNK